MSVPCSALVNTGKDCIAVVKHALDDIRSGREEMAIKRLSALQRDSVILADAAERLAIRLEAVEKHYQNKDAEMLSEIGNLNGKESQLKIEKSEEEGKLSAQLDKLQDSKDQLSSAEDELREAEDKRTEAEENERKIQIRSTVIGLFVLGPIGAAVGAGIGAIVNACRKEEEKARAAVKRRRSDLDDAHSAVNENKKRISNVVSQVKSLTEQVERMQQKRSEVHKKVEEIRGLIVLVKKSVAFWLLFKQISEHGANRTTLLQRIVTGAAEKGDYRALQSKSSFRIANTFIEAWEEMETTVEYGGPNHILEIEYKCSRCGVQHIALPHVDNSTLVCAKCHNKYPYVLKS